MTFRKRTGKALMGQLRGYEKKAYYFVPVEHKVTKALGGGMGIRVSYSPTIYKSLEFG